MIKLILIAFVLAVFVPPMLRVLVSLSDILATLGKVFAEVTGAIADYRVKLRTPERDADSDRPARREKLVKLKLVNPRRPSAASYKGKLREALVAWHNCNKVAGNNRPYPRWLAVEVIRAMRVCRMASVMPKQWLLLACKDSTVQDIVAGRIKVKI